MKRVGALVVVMAIAAPIVGLLFLGAFMVVIGGGTAEASSYQCQTSTTPLDPATAKNTGWSPEQRSNAAKIVEQVKRDIVPVDQLRAAIVALATAMQESTLINVDRGDRAGPDSRGLFQQRAPWGPLADRMDPHKSAHMFLTGGRGGQPGLLDIAGWQHMSVTQAAQAVQVSAFPTAYAKWEGPAKVLAAALLGSSASGADLDPCGGLGGPEGTVPVTSSDVGAMLATAKTLLGTPYLWGGDGSGNPPRVDCSGLIVYAWRKIGKPLRIRTSEQMWSYSTQLQPGSEQPGDLIFSEFGPRGPGHVMIVWDPTTGRALEAPHTGDVVKLINYKNYKNLPNQRFGRLKPSAWSAQP